MSYENDHYGKDPQGYTTSKSIAKKDIFNLASLKFLV